MSTISSRPLTPPSPILPSPHPEIEDVRQEMEKTLFSTLPSSSPLSSSAPRLVEIPSTSLSEEEREALKTAKVEAPKGSKLEDAAALSLPAASLSDTRIVAILKKCEGLRILEISFSEEDQIKELDLTPFARLTTVHIKGTYQEKLDLSVGDKVQVSVKPGDQPAGKVKIHYCGEGGKKTSKTAPGLFYKTNLKIENYNNKREFEGETTKYACRHAAVDNLLQPEALIKKRTDKDIQVYSNRAAYRKAEILGDTGEKIQKRPFALQQQFHTLIENAKENAIVSNQAWNAFCREHLQEMQKEIEGVTGDQTIKRGFLVSSPNHVMTLHLIVKKENDKISYALSFFDPNETTTDTRVAFDHIEDIDKSGPLFRNFLKKGWEKEYFGEGADESCTLFTRAPEPCTAEAIQALKDNPPERRLKYYGKPCLSGDLLYHMTYAKLDRLDAGQALLKERIEALKENPDLFFAFLSDLGPGPNGCSGLYMVLSYGSPGTIKLCMDAIVELAKAGKLTGEQLETLLLNQDEEGTPGLYWALRKDRADVVKIYLHAVLELAQAGKLTGEQLETLLLAKSDEGTPGLYWALQEGHADVVKIYLHAVLELAKAGKLTGGQLEMLLLAKSDEGTPGFYWALKDGRADVVKTYLHAVLELAKAGKLTGVQLETLLLAKNNQGTAGFYWASCLNKIEIAQIYLHEVEKLVKANKLTGMQLETILLAKFQDFSTLHVALGKGHIEIFQQSLLEMGRLHKTIALGIFQSKDFLLSLQTRENYSDPKRLKAYMEGLQHLRKEGVISGEMLHEILFSPPASLSLFDENTSFFSLSQQDGSTESAKMVQDYLKKWRMAKKETRILKKTLRAKKSSMTSRSSFNSSLSSKSSATSRSLYSSPSPSKTTSPLGISPDDLGIFGATTRTGGTPQSTLHTHRTTTARRGLFGASSSSTSSTPPSSFRSPSPLSFEETALFGFSQEDGLSKYPKRLEEGKETLGPRPTETSTPKKTTTPRRGLFNPKRPLAGPTSPQLKKVKESPSPKKKG